jgi:macrocin-O-methyltransferase TylF-like protien
MLELFKVLLRDIRERGRPAGTAAAPTGETVQYALVPPPAWYHQDGLTTIHNHEFMQDPEFVRAYARGVQAAGGDYRIHWRVHIALWAARCAAKLEGDFVECGVNYGFVSSAIMSGLDWDRLGKTFWLLDTFSGLDERYVSREEIVEGALKRNAEHMANEFYVKGVDGVRRNFSEWRNARIIVGAVPETLPQVDAAKIAFVHLDMNCAPPEVAAAEFFWRKMAPGAPLLLDDYAYEGYRLQKLAMDAFARSKGVAVASLPTGQGLIIKPPS